MKPVATSFILGGVCPPETYVICARIQLKHMLEEERYHTDIVLLYADGFLFDCSKVGGSKCNIEEAERIHIGKIITYSRWSSVVKRTVIWD
jgi:hypothetical protein